MATLYAPLLQQMMLEFQSQRLESAERIACSILRINPKDLVALQVQGLCFAMQGRAEESVEPFAKAAMLDPKNSELLKNLAKTQHQAGRYSDAVQTFEKLKRLIPNNPQILTDMGTALAKLKQYDKAKALYEQVISLDPDYFLVWSNQGNLYWDQGYPVEAITCFERALQLNPDYAEAWTNYGNALFDLGRFDESCEAHDQAIARDINYAEAWFNKANSLIKLKHDDLACVHYSKAFELKPTIPFLIGHLINSLAVACNWERNENLVSEALQAVKENKPAVPPFILLHTPASLSLQKQAAQIYIREHIPYINESHFQSLNRIPDRKIRIGYFSSDFKEHPVGILIENLIRLHDRSRFEIYGYFLNAKSDSALEDRLKKSFDKTYELFRVHDQDAHNLVVEHGLDIAIDLNGHTEGARTGLFARKIAPLQINYLGYAGTLGANFYDYLIADRVAVPQVHMVHYTEKLAYMPNSFFPADTLVHYEDFGSMPSRDSQGVPEEVFVFACFNNSYKIEPQVFTLWMKLLKQVNNSVLWLSTPSELAKQNLLESARKLGVEPSRLIFASRVPARKDHLSRLRLADLFLDTPYFNAHTTAADALWAGVPVLTQIGETFAGRVAASQLSALDMPELIVDTQDEYLVKALELATQPQLLKEIRAKLWSNRLTTPLFNTKLYVEDLEELFCNLLEQKS